VAVSDEFGSRWSALRNDSELSAESERLVVIAGRLVLLGLCEFVDAVRDIF
jgi:hypothetical protein